jgi:hypothetical protein
MCNKTDRGVGREVIPDQQEAQLREVTSVTLSSLKATLPLLSIVEQVSFLRYISTVSSCSRYCLTLTCALTSLHLF